MSSRNCDVAREKGEFGQPFREMCSQYVRFGGKYEATEIFHGGILVLEDVQNQNQVTLTIPGKIVVMIVDA